MFKIRALAKQTVFVEILDFFRFRFEQLLFIRDKFASPLLQSTFSRPEFPLKADFAVG
jgi:hypothetical protein